MKTQASPQLHGGCCGGHKSSCISHNCFQSGRWGKNNDQDGTLSDQILETTNTPRNAKKVSSAQATWEFHHRHAARAVWLARGRVLRGQVSAPLSTSLCPLHWPHKEGVGRRNHQGNIISVRGRLLAYRLMTHIDYPADRVQSCCV